MAASGRAYWQGFLRLSLVSIAVEVFNAEDKRSEISFNQIHKPTGKRIHYTKTIEGGGEVDPDDIASGYAIDKDVYIIMEPEEIDAVRLESKKTIELSQFVDLSDVDPRYFEQPYYIVPTDEYATEGYLVIREALRKTGKMGVGQLTASGREHLIGVSPLENGLMLSRLRYANEIKSSSQFFKELPKMRLDHEMVDLATELIDKKAVRFNPEEFKDHYAAELKQLIEQKAKGHTIVAEPEPEPERGKVVNLMDALRSSLQNDGMKRDRSRAEKTSARKATAKSKSTTRRSVRH
jgi:DNA end-binding protein Ku